MINPKAFYDSLINNNVEFFTGVPDSLLKSILSFITINSSKKNHIIAANEGGAVGLAIGYHIATGKLPLVYMQNSGMGNMMNPILSLADKEIYSIPILLMIGWRGEPAVKDEPQHLKQGKVTLEILDTFGIPYKIIDANSNFELIIKEQANLAIKESKPVALVIRKNSFEEYKIETKLQDYISREAAIKIIVDSINQNDVVISTTGKTSRELFEYRMEKNQENSSDFLTVGGMGHASSIALGIAIEKKNKDIICLDGDGAALMHLGSMGIAASLNPDNFLHIILNNGAHDSVGGQPTIGGQIDFTTIAKGLGYQKVFSAINKKEIIGAIQHFKSNHGLTLLEIKLRKGARKNLGRPTKTPKENKNSLMNLL